MADAHKSHSTTKLKTMRKTHLIDLTRDSSDSDGGSRGNDGAVKRQQKHNKPQNGNDGAIEQPIKNSQQKHNKPLNQYRL